MDKTTNGSDTREARALDDSVMGFDLAGEIAQLRDEPGYADFGRSSITLGKSEHVRLVLTAARQGVKLGNEQADGAIAVQVLEGQVRVGRDGANQTFGAGSEVWLGEGEPWTVATTQDSALLLTVGWPGGGAAR